MKAGFCRQSHIKGGVAIYVSNTIQEKAEAVDLQELCVEMICEAASVKIRLGKTQLFVVGVYRTHGNLETGLDVISDVLEKISAEKHSTVLIGDVNIDCLKKDNDYFLFNNTLNCYGLHRVDLPPTRVTPTSQTSIDTVCTNLEKEEVIAEVINTAISDHTGQMCKVMRDKGPIAAQASLSRRNMSTRNLLKLKELLGQENWLEVYSTRNVDEAYNKFNNILQRALNHTCPVTRKRNARKKNLKMLSDPMATQLKQEFLTAQNLFCASGREDHKRRASNLKREYDLHVRSLKKQDNITKITEADNKSKAIWKVINSERKPKEETNKISKLNIEGHETTNSKEIADHLNNFFINVAEETIKKNGKRNNQFPPGKNQDTPNLVLKSTTRQEMSKMIKSFQPKTSAGYDDISSKLLKLCEEELKDPLVDITNKSFHSGIFPKALKVAKVYAKFKNGSTTEASNYRPISLIPTFSKVIEKLVLNRLFEHLNSNKLLTPHQHGFLAKRSTITALISLVEFLLDQQEEGNTSTAILLDYSKAFDCLDHSILLEKLTALGVDGTSKTWFSSYLKDRSQMVQVTCDKNGKTETVTSTQERISRGVPQGSVLGPVLFILFTNDFPNFMQDYSQTLMYADDTVLLLSRANPKELDINSYIALNMAIQYCHNNDLVVNENKSKQLLLGRHKEDNGKVPDLEEVTSAEYLGVTIDNKLTWTQHIDSLCRKLSTGIYVMKRMKSISDPMTTKTAYHALFESHLRYGIVVWGGTTAKNLQRILILQKRAIRILGNLQPRETCREAFQEWRILTVVSLYILETASYVHVQEPDAVKTGAKVHEHNTRHVNNYNLPVHSRTSTERKPSYIGAKIYNTLPEDLKKTKLPIFKDCLKNWLLDNPFYTMSEFFDWKKL